MPAKTVPIVGKVDCGDISNQPPRNPYRTPPIVGVMLANVKTGAQNQLSFGGFAGSLFSSHFFRKRHRMICNIDAASTSVTTDIEAQNKTPP